MALEKFGKMIGNIASTTAKKAGEQAQIAKLGIDRSGVERQIEGVYAAMGRYCYTQIKAGAQLPEELGEYCRDIDTLNEQLRQLEENIAAHKSARDAAEYTVSADFKEFKGDLKGSATVDYVSADIPEQEEEAGAGAEASSPEGEAAE